MDHSLSFRYQRKTSDLLICLMLRTLNVGWESPSNVLLFPPIYSRSRPTRKDFPFFPSPTKKPSVNFCVKRRKFSSLELSVINITSITSSTWMMEHMWQVGYESDPVMQFVQGYQDFLQPLMDNLESQTYEFHWKRKTPNRTLMVIGAGRGPLVRAALTGAEKAERHIRVYAVHDKSQRHSHSAVSSRRRVGRSTHHRFL
uniref:PRMT5 arginine-N-methyltransferase domain-containing protein n=1 Tax=Daphnia galeata TaxID=27404 RepID=A0A8J2RR74_9CRUS|nr:unnamed protein product [Daphnia galeata]